MSTIRNTKNRIKSVQTTTKVTKAMKAIAAMRLKKYALKADLVEKYSQSLMNSLNSVLTSIPNGSLPSSITGNPKGKILLIITAPSRGFCGGLHRTCVSDCIKHFDNLGIDISDPNYVEIITINRPAKRLVSKVGGKILASFDGPYKQIDTYTILPISELVTQLWKTNTYKSVFLSYAKSNSALRANVFVDQVLPFLVPVKDNTQTPVNIDTDQDLLLEEVLPQLAHAEIHLALLLTQKAEEAARMLAMNQATDNAKELEKKLQLIFFRQRQAKITQEIAEIVGASL